MQPLTGLYIFLVSSTIQFYLGESFYIGPCLVNTNHNCPDKEVTFFLFTQLSFGGSQQILVNETGSNLEETFFIPWKPTKIVIHGFNADMNLSYLARIRREYLSAHDYNVIAVDWHRLAAGVPCYPIVVLNMGHVGHCLAQLIERLKDAGAEDIHVIGFSLGAHVTASTARRLWPYKLPRITGLDPAMPLFITTGNSHKLSVDDAEFVDVIHTNALMQGKMERCGHIDFYMNGGVTQPGCWAKGKSFFECNHHRALVYFAESINTDEGFWGWPCNGFLSYVLGMCSSGDRTVLAGEEVNKSNRGFHLVRTNSESPFAMGRDFE